MMDINITIVVDDEPLMCDVVAEMINERCKRVIKCFSGPEAMSAFSKLAKVDLIITDMRMPIMSGLQFLERVRQIDPFIPVIIMTGYDDASIVQESLTSGVEEIIMKPFKKEELNSTIDRALWRATSKRRSIILEYVLEANDLISKSDKPNKEHLLNIGRRIISSINMSNIHQTGPTGN